MPDLPPERQEYTVEEIDQAGMIPLFLAFETGFRTHLQKKASGWPEVKKAIQHRVPQHILQELRDCEIPNIAEAPNFNRYRGDLERACAAAKHLLYRYDLGIGIAKKGLWTSYIFHLFGLPTKDCLAIRLGDYGKEVLCAPLDPLLTEDVEGKKILVFDNDIVTGASVKAVCDHLKKANPASIDLLLIYGSTEISAEFYEAVKGRFKHSPTIYGERNGNMVLDCRGEAVPHVRKVLTIDEYLCLKEKLHPLQRALNVPP